MKKGFLGLLAWLVLTGGFADPVLGQNAPERFGNYINFEFTAKDKMINAVMPGTYRANDHEVSQVFNYMQPDVMRAHIVPASPMLLGVKLNPDLTDFFPTDVKSGSKSFKSYLISDGSAATIIALGITKNNIKDYRYRVVENDSTEIVHWSAIPALQQNYGAEAPYGFIGKFQSPGKQLLVEVVNINNYSIRDGVIFDWRASFRPTLAQIVISTPETNKTRKNFFNLNYLQVNRGMATKFDQQTSVPSDFKFHVDSVSNIRLYFKHHESVAYAIFLIGKSGSKADTTELAIPLSENSFDVGSKYFSKPGSYQLLIQRLGWPGRWPEEQVLRIPFEVKPPPFSEKKVSLKQLLPYTIAILSGIVLAFLLYRRQSRTKLIRAAQAQQIVGLKLQSIRAQLNPHFMFNALTSIQSLINKNNISGANYYLSKFAGLTRQVLDSSNDEMVSLESELNVLRDYLQMEQLRFNFKYEIKVDENLNQANIEIPPMLLQPFAENAIKHGIAGLNDDGLIVVVVSGDSGDLILSVTDNGKGFEKGIEAGGYGIKLSEERIALLNEVYPDQSVTLNVNPTQSGTTVIIRLSKWIV